MSAGSAAEALSQRFRCGRYETLFRIGGGGMAEVYAARATGEAGFQKLVALKRIHPHMAKDERMASMFIDEGRLAANILSPHVVQTLDLGRADDGSLYLVMEFVLGVSLAQLLQEVRRAKQLIPVGVAVELCAQAAQGLDDAHNAQTPLGEPLGIVHRDVSPQNVIIGVDGRARIADFGVAQALQRATETRTGELKGKFSYFAPEQVREEPLDRRVDVFALGIVTWEALVGRRLFAGGTTLQQLQRILRMLIPTVGQLRPEVPESISAVVARALQRDVSRRTPSAAEFARALREAARQEGLTAEPSEVAAYLRAQASKRIAEIEEAISASFGSGGVAGGAVTVTEPEITRGGWGKGLSPGTIQLGDEVRSRMVDSADGATATVPGSRRGGRPAPPDTSEPAGAVAPPRHRLPKLVAVAAAVALVGTGLAVWLLRADPQSDVSPTTVLPPPTTLAPAADEAPSDDEVLADEETSIADEESVASPVAELDPEVPEDVEESPVAEPEAEQGVAEAPIKPKTVRRRRRPRRRATAPPTTSPPSAAPSASPSQRRTGAGAVVGVDAFDRDLENR